MVKLSVLLALLLQLRVLMIVSRQSPCPSVFTYFRDSVTNKTMGKIWLLSRPQNQVEYHLEVVMSIDVRLPNNYTGEVTLEKSREDTIRDIQRGMPLVYLIHFPLEQPLPRIIKIRINGEQKCSGTRLLLTPFYNGFIEMEHFLFFDNSTQKWFETSVANLSFGIIPEYETYSSYGGGLDVPLYAPIFDVFPTISPAHISKPDKHGPTIGDIEGCGRNAKIVVPLIANGVSQGEWPWVVALFVQRHNFEYQSVGTILTNSHIITATHCWAVKDLNVNLVPTALYASLERNKLREWREDGSVNIEVLNYTIYPDYAYDASANFDLAILTFWSSVEFSPNIHPICWEGPRDLENVVSKTDYVAGWGRDEYGNDLYSRGDSATGLMLYDLTKDPYYMREVASRSLVDRRSLPCDLNHYVDVAKYTDWIRKQISKN